MVTTQLAMPKNSDPSAEVTDDELGFSTLAVRIGGWGTKTIFTGIILLIGVTFGRQVLIWWGHQGAPELGTSQSGQAVSGGELAKPFLPQWIQFGESPISVQTQRLRGDRQQVLKRLLDSAKQVLAAADPLKAKLGPSEKRLLRWITKKKPVAKAADGLLFQSEGPMPMVVAVRPNKEKSIAAQFRVVSWGLGLPAASDAAEWMLYTYSAHQRRSPIVGKNLPELPRPTGSRKILALQASSGSGLFVLAGPGTLDSWKDQIQSHMGQRDWQRKDEWRQLGGVWLAQFNGPKQRQLIVQLARGKDDELQAIMTIVGEVR